MENEWSLYSLHMYINNRPEQPPPTHLQSVRVCVCVWGCPLPFWSSVTISQQYIKCIRFTSSLEMPLYWSIELYHLYLLLSQHSCWHYPAGLCSLANVATIGESWTKRTAVAQGCLAASLVCSSLLRAMGHALTCQFLRRCALFERIVHKIYFLVPSCW